MAPRVHRACTLLGVGFLLLGLLTALGIGMSLQLGLSPHWTLYVYALLNALIAFGFFTKQYWIYPALAANFGAQLVLLLMRMTQQTLSQPEFLGSAIIVVVNGILVVIAYSMRKHLGRSQTAQYAGGLFLALWAVALCYTIATNLS